MIIRTVNFQNWITQTDDTLMEPLGGSELLVPTGAGKLQARLALVEEIEREVKAAVYSATTANENDLS